MTEPGRRKSAWILAVIAAIECGWVLLNLRVNGWRFVRYLGFAPGLSGSVSGWLGATVVVVLFVAFAMRLPSVRENLFRPSFLKLLAIFVAIGAGILEEVIFRRWVMNYVAERGFDPVVQILASGLLFGLAHGVWGLFGMSLRAALGATISTGLLGLMLGAVFLLAGRSLAPCICAHIAINLCIEPGLVLAAVRGEMT
jgi:uncharacterized protein